MLKKYGLWGLIIAIHLAFFIYRLNEGQLILSDSEEYIYAADNLFEHGTLYSADMSAREDMRAYTKRPPVYPAFILVFKGIFRTSWAVILLQNLLSLFNIWVVFKILSHLGYAKNKWLAGLLFILTPAQFIYADTIMSEIVMQSLILGFVYQMFRFISEYDIKPLLWGALMLVLAMLTKPVMYPFVYAYLLVVIVYAVWLKKYKLILAGIIPLLVVVGYQQINKARTGYKHFSSISDINLLQYNTRYMLQNFYSIQYADSLVASIQETAVQKPTFKEQQEYKKRASFNILKNHKRAYSIFHIKGMVTFILDPGRFDLYNYFSVDRSQQGFLHYISAEGLQGVVSYLRTQPIALVILLMVIALINFIKALLVMLFLFSKKIPVEVKVILLGIIFYIAFLTGPLGASRFMLPVLPLIVMAITMAWDDVKEMTGKVVSRLKFL